MARKILICEQGQFSVKKTYKLSKTFKKCVSSILGEMVF